MTKTEITQGSQKDYLQWFALWCDQDTDFFVQRALQGNGGLYILWQNGKALGYLTFYPNANECLIDYAFTRPDARRQYVFTSLLQYAVQKSPRRLRVNIIDTAACFDIVRRVCQKLEFTECEKLIIYRGYLDNSYSLWQAYLAKKGNALLTHLQHYGYYTCSLAEASNEQLLYLLNSTENSFGNTLPVRHFLLNPQHKLNKKLSHLVLKEGLPVAYVLITSPDAHSMVYEQISTAQSAMTTGSILLAFAATLDAGHQAHIRRVRYAMHESNIAANAFRKKIIDQLQLQSHTSYKYMKEVARKTR